MLTITNHSERVSRLEFCINTPRIARIPVRMRNTIPMMKNVLIFDMKG